MFNFLKKKGDSPPDVGQEEAYDEKNDKMKPLPEVASVVPKKLPVAVDPLVVAPPVRGAVGDMSNEINKFEFNKINVKVEGIGALVKGLSERLMQLNQQLGEVRSMNLENEKSISKATLGSAKAIDIVNSVKPDKLRIDYQRVDLKVTTLLEKLEANKQFTQTVLEEVKELRRKSEVFIGTESLLTLNEDVKKDLIELQKMSARVRINADKSEQLFMELRRGFAESQKVNEIIKTLDLSYSGLQKELEKLRLDYTGIVKRGDFDDFKKNMAARFVVFENSLVKLDQINEKNERLGSLIENIFSVAQKNEQDIRSLAVAVGDGNNSSVQDYDKKFVSILNLLGGVASEIDGIKKHVGMKISKKVLVKKDINDLKKPVVGKIVKPVVNPIVKKKIVKPVVKEKIIKKAPVVGRIPVIKKEIKTEGEIEKGNGEDKKKEFDEDEKKQKANKGETKESQGKTKKESASSEEAKKETSAKTEKPKNHERKKGGKEVESRKGAEKEKAGDEKAGAGKKRKGRKTSKKRK